MIIIRNLEPHELEWANECYKTVEFLPSTTDEYIIVAIINNEKVGLGRIIPFNFEHTIGEMGGIYVVPQYRRKNIASSIVKYLSQQNYKYKLLYCIPFIHLEHFYASYGFCRIKENMHIHEKAIQKLEYCKNNYINPMCLMYKELENSS